jgi:hypothetical protein
LFGLFLIGIAFGGCEKDLYDEHIHLAKIKSQISLEEFKRETGLTDFKTSIKIKSNVGISEQRNADGSYELSDFNIDTSIIKKIVFNEKITYTFQLIPIEEVNDRFFNITYFYKDGWQSQIVEIKPTEENLIQLKEGNTKTVDGTIARVYRSDLTEDSQTCQIVIIWIENCQGCIGTCDGCAICLYHTSVEQCSPGPSPLYLDPGSSTGGGSYSDGGVTNSINNEGEDEISTSLVLPGLVSETLDIPCPGDPIKNPEICPSSAGNTAGGTFGCTRNNPKTSCNGYQGKKKHAGIDIKGKVGDPVFNMHRGKIVDIRKTMGNTEYLANSLGNFIEIESVINGITTRIKYCHLGNVKFEMNDIIPQGRLIADVGRSGNAGAKGVTTHLHIQSKAKEENIWTVTNPINYFNTTFDETTFETINNCN